MSLESNSFTEALLLIKPIHGDHSVLHLGDLPDLLDLGNLHLDLH